MLKSAFNGQGEQKAKIARLPEKPVESKTLLRAFADFIEKFIKQVEKGQRSNDTLKHWKSAKRKVEDFLIFEYQTTDMDLKDIRFNFAQRFYDFMTLELDEPVSELTAKGYIKKTKQILKQCISEEHIDRNPMEEYSCAGGDKDVEPLEMFEVQKLVDKQINCERLEKVQDAFLFQIFTGFAFQDLYGLNKEHIIKVGIEGERWLIKERGKTEVTEMVPILPIEEALIEKYKNHPYCIKNNCLIPISCNQRYNAYLKELAYICGIGRELNTHLARHTFADIMLNSGVPLEDVSKMLGHKSIRTTQRYCKVRKNRISRNMVIAKNALFTEDGLLRRVS